MRGEEGNKLKTPKLFFFVSSLDEEGISNNKFKRERRKEQMEKKKKKRMNEMDEGEKRGREKFFCVEKVKCGEKERSRKRKSGERIDKSVYAGPFPTHTNVKIENRKVAGVTREWK